MGLSGNSIRLLKFFMSPRRDEPTRQNCPRFRAFFARHLKREKRRKTSLTALTALKVVERKKLCRSSCLQNYWAMQKLFVRRIGFFILFFLRTMTKIIEFNSQCLFRNRIESMFLNTSWKRFNKRCTRKFFSQLEK